MEPGHAEGVLVPRTLEEEAIAPTPGNKEWPPVIGLTTALEMVFTWWSVVDWITEFKFRPFPRYSGSHWQTYCFLPGNVYRCLLEENFVSSVIVDLTMTASKFRYFFCLCTFRFQNSAFRHHYEMCTRLRNHVGSPDTLLELNVF